MERIFYAAPTLELLEMEVEQGFMRSEGTDSQIVGLDYDSDSHTAME